MSIQEQIVSAFGLYGIGEVAFYPVPETRLTSIRITDQAYDQDVVSMIVTDILEDIIEPIGAHVSSYGSNAYYETDEKKGAVIVVAGL